MKKITPEFVLRIGLAITFLYAGVNALINPTNWIGFVPNWVQILISKNIFLAVHSVFEIILSAWLILGYKTKTAAIITFLDLTAMIIFFGIDDVTFRDFGLAFSALALFLLSKNNPIRV